MGDGNAFDQMAAKDKQQSNQSVTIPSLVAPVTTDQPTTGNVGGTSVTMHGVTQDQLNAAVIPPTSGNAGNAFDQLAQQEPEQGTSGHGASGSWESEPEPTKIGTMPRLGEVWKGVSEPLIPRGSISKAAAEYATSGPTNSSAKHPYVTAALKGSAGTVADTMEFARSMTSPVMIATLELGEIAKAGGAIGKLAKASGLLAGIGFGAQGAVNAYEGVHRIGQEGLTPETASQTLTGAAMVVPGVAAGLHPFKFANKPIGPEIVRPSVKVTPKNVAGVKISQAQVIQPEQNLATRVASHLTTPGKVEANLRDLQQQAETIHAEETKPAAQRAAVSTLSQVATDKMEAHRAIASGEQAPEPITGTQTPGEHLTPDEIWPKMQQTAGETWQKARDASARDTSAWQQQRTAAEQAHQAGIDHYNDLVDAHNADPANADNPMDRQVFNPEEVDAPEKPKTYDELKADLDAAKDRLGRNNPTDVREKAKTVEVPKAEKALDAWFKDHENAVSSTEYQSAKSLWADSERFREIAQNLRGKIAKGTLNGNDIRGLEAVVDNKAVTRRGAAGIGEFRRLVGPEAYENLRNVADVFDPLEKTDPRASVIPSWGGWIARHALATVLAPALGGLSYLGIEGGNALLEMMMNHVMFDPEFGSTFKAVADATKSAFETGSQVPVSLAGKFRDMLLGIAEKYRASKFGGEEGAVGAGVKRKNVGPSAGARPLSPSGTPLPKEWPSDDKLVEKYGEASDPAQTAFLLTDGRKVKMPLGSEHDRMLGGKPTDDFRTPYINETGNIRMRSYGVYGDRQFGLSLPKGGITDAQLKEILKWGPQLRTGRVFLEQADANGKNVTLHNATNAQLEEGIRSIVPIKESAAPQAGASVAEGADSFNQSEGRPPIKHEKMEPDVRRGDVATAFDEMQHAPEDPKVAKSYAALKDDVKKQWDFATKEMGIKIDPTDKDPYKNEQQMFDDVKNNKHLSVWRGGNPLEEGHPLAEVDKDTGENYNTMLRAIHDIFGHVAGDHDFSEGGEESAWGAHKQMFSPEAQPAMTTETRGQTSWFYGNKGVVPGEFAPQKAGIMPGFTGSRTPTVEELTRQQNFNRGFTLNGNEGLMRGKPGFSVAGEHPELEAVIPGQKLRPEDLQKYLDRPDVQEALKDPNNSLGGWFHNGNTHLEVSRLFQDKNAAIEAGRRLNQNAIFDHSTKTEIPTGGNAADIAATAQSPAPSFAGMDFSVDNRAFDQAKQELADGKITRDQLLSRAQELKEAAKAAPADLSASEITTRRPTSVKGDRANNPNQHANWDAIEQADRNNPSGKTALGGTKLGYKEKLARTVANYTGIEYTPEELANPDKVLSKFVTRVSGNLEWLYNQVPEEMRAQTRTWYDNANKVVTATARQFGFTPEQGAGVTAALSPQNPWDNNLGLANRMMDIYQNRQNVPFSPEMEIKTAELRKVPTQSKTFRGLLRDIDGKKLSEIKNDNPNVEAAQKALWIRLYDEAHGSPINDQYAPSGEVVGHSPDTRSWIGLDHALKAVKIMENGSVDAINSVMGQGHKIRNFYDNLVNPASNAGHVTIDTHATAAAHLSPFGSKDTEASHTFGNSTPGTPGPPKNASTGLQGTYPLYAEAYQRVARKLGILPRELQSVTWEAVKSLFDNKKGDIKPHVKEIWQDVEEGKLTPEEARDRIKTVAGGFSKPAWMSDEEWEKSGPEGEDTSFEGGK